MNYYIYPIACHPGEQRKLSVGSYMMIDGYTLSCEGSAELYSEEEFKDVVAELQKEFGDDAHYALVKTNEDDSTEVIGWS